MQAAGILLPNLVLPLLTNPGDQTKIQVFLHVEPLPNITGSCARGADPIGDFGLVRLWLTNCYHDLACAGGPFLVGLDLITNPYHSPDLGAGLPCVAFTNLYHRDEGTRH